MKTGFWFFAASSILVAALFLNCSGGEAAEGASDHSIIEALAHRRELAARENPSPEALEEADRRIRRLLQAVKPVGRLGKELTIYDSTYERVEDDNYRFQLAVRLEEPLNKDATVSLQRSDGPGSGWSTFNAADWSRHKPGDALLLTSEFTAEPVPYRIHLQLNHTRKRKNPKGHLYFGWAAAW